MLRKYFGTDGVRARVGTSPMVPETILKLGWAVGRTLASERGDKVLIGKDTRLSGYMFESALEAGLSAAGVDILLLGPLPTPGVSCLTQTLHGNVGFVISASHNPYYDNGIKLFARDGRKLSDEQEYEIERRMDEPLKLSKQLGKARRVDDAVGRYAEFCKRSVGNKLNLKGVKVVIDCANGAGYIVAPHVFEELGATVYAIGITPDGSNINVDCGTLHLEGLQHAVLDKQADFGIAMDGDGDRLIMIDEKGDVLDGDELLMIVADARHRQEGIQGVVGTHMSNLGLEKALAQRGVAFHRVQVGDRYVMQELDEQSWLLGGEPSGHIICLDKSPAGDSIIAALEVINALQTTGQRLSEAKTLISKYPQKIINVNCEGEFDSDAGRIQEVIAAADKTLGEEGRVVIRPSGTEPLVRVMVEAEKEEICSHWAQEIADAVKTAQARDTAS